MKKSLIIIFLFCVIFIGFSDKTETANAGKFTFVRDSISRSAPGVQANHTIEFIATSVIPANGSIRLSFQSGEFSIPNTLDFTDVDFLEDGNNQTLANSNDATTQGISVVAGQNGSITIQLDQSTGINAGTQIAVKIGLHATYQSAGDENIKNPLDPGTYQINIDSFDNLGNAIDNEMALIAIIEGVGVGGTPQLKGGPGGSGDSGENNNSISNTEQPAINDDSPVEINESLPPQQIQSPVYNPLIDVSGDSKIDLVDFSIILSNWGTPTATEADLNDDGIVDLVDISILLFYLIG